MNKPARGFGFRLASYFFWGRHPRKTLARAALLAAGCYVVFRWLLLPVWLSGESMEPTLSDRSFRLVSRVHYKIRQPERGDIVVIRMAAGHKTMYLKRILGLPGERVRFKDGVFMVDNNPLPEPYVVRNGSWNTGEVTLGPSQYFVAGDNRAMNAREHVMGVTHRSRLEGLLLW